MAYTLEGFHCTGCTYMFQHTLPLLLSSCLRNSTI